MKYPFIIIGSVAIVAVIGAAVGFYFFLFYTHTAPAHTAPNPFSEASSSKGFDALAAEKAAQASIATTPGVSTANVRLVTLRKTIGALGLVDGTVRFVESGTGHIYQVDSTGNETKLSGTTFPGARSAVWSTEGTRVAITREVDTSTLETFNGVIQKNDTGTMTLEGSVILGTVRNVAYSESGDILYYTQENTHGGVEGISKNLKTNKTQTLFTTPLHDIVVAWEPTIIITTKPSVALFSGQSGNSLISWLQTGAHTVALPRGVLPEKCDHTGNILICAVPSNFEAGSYPDRWYRGEITYNDALWQFDMNTGSSTPLFDFEGHTNKQIDVRSIAATKTGYLLEGKSDDSLWFVQNPLTQ
jgi:hypothetical protein